MKSIFKFMTVALAAGLAVSCSDELNLEKKGYVAKEGDLNGTLYTAEPTRVALLEDIGSSTTPVWSLDDKVNVFSAKRLNYNQYTLAAGEGTSQGIFEPVGTPDLIGLTDLYAITEAEYQYGVSATKENDGKILLTAEIPQSFEWSKLAAEQNSYKLPSPYWGAASFGDDGQLNVFFRPLTGILRLDLALLPAGVTGIVLVTGNNTEYNQHQYFINPAKDEVTGELLLNDGITGSSEGLSGHFNTVLDYQHQTDYEPLGNDRALVCFDTLRVDFPEATKLDENKVVYIPLIAQHYDNLKVLAVTGDYLDPYMWDGEILREFNDLTVDNGDIINLAMTAELELTTTSLATASEQIAQAIDGKHAINVSLPNIVVDGADSVLYIVHNLNKKTDKTNVIVNFPNDLDHGIEIAEKEAVWTGNVPNDGAQWLRWGNKIYKEDFTKLFEKGKNAQPNATVEPVDTALRTVTLNFQAAVPEYINVTLPTSNVVMNYEAASAGELPVVNVLTANTVDVSGYDYDQTYNAVSLEQKAGLTFKGVYGVVNYYSGGAVYFFDEESEITESLNIFGKNPKGLRITDGLINTITYPYILNVDQGTTNKTFIYTTGSAAIKQLLDPTDKVKIKAYWSGRRLTPFAVSQGYEGEKVKDNGDGSQNYNIAEGAIYTAAQLQGMGLSKKVYDYTISPRVESIWLGGVTFPWIGAEIEDHADVTATATSLPAGNGKKISDAFILDGRNVTLKNMILDIYDPNLVLPGCCGTTQRLRVLKNLGLIRSIRTEYTSEDSAAVDIFNINLDDVLLKTTYPIDNIGSLVGIIDAEGDVVIGGNETSQFVGTTISSFTDIRIESKGNNIGGVVGELESKGNVTIAKIFVESKEANSTYIHGGQIIGHNNVGGIVGRLTYDGAYDNPKDNPELGTTAPDTTYTYKFYKVTRGPNNAGKVLWANDKSVFYDGNADGANDTKFQEELAKLYIISGTEFASYIPGTSAGIANPPTDVDFYTLKDGVYTKKGKLVKGENERDNYYWTDGDNVKHTAKLSTPNLEEKTPTAGKVRPIYDSNTEDAEAVDAIIPADFDIAGNTYFVKDSTRHIGTKTVGGDYPASLTVFTATVNLVPTSVKGTVKAENGNNAGGMFGYAAVDGNTRAESEIKVTVPLITATTEKVYNTLGTATQAVNQEGNHAGGLIGNYQNVNKSTDPIVKSFFAGTITASDGIIAENQKAGGVLGLQTTKLIVHDATHKNPAQVYFAGNGGNTVDALTITAGEISATNGHAGGVVGYQESGKVSIAAGKAVTVTAGSLNGAYAVGGAIGEQGDDASVGTGAKFTATIGDMTLAGKTISFFPNNTDREMLGTFGTVIGIKNHWLEINPGADGTNIATTALTKDQRIALLFKKHSSAATTEEEQSGKYFWGDNKGWVGYATETSMYFAPNDIQGNYEMNVYKEY